MQFLVLGHDGTDPEAGARRAAARSAHLQASEALRTEGALLYAAALLDDAGAMTGSAMVVDFPDRAELDAWLEQEPYVTGKVWRRVEVTPCRPGPAFAAGG